MNKFFIPYHFDKPAAVDIKGHKLLIVSTRQEDIEQELEAIGGSELRELELLESDTETLAGLAADINGGVVLTPPGISVVQMLHSLEEELPWIH